MSKPVTGLAPGTTYHYRLVATSSDGTTYGGDQVFQTDGAAAAPSESRGYEMVSPADGKNNASVDPNFVGTKVSADGDRVVYTTREATYDGAASTPLAPRVLATRAPTGWANLSLEPPQLN